MNDVMLFARLKSLGVPQDKAWDLTRRIRDVYHPVAAVAANRILNRTRGMGAAAIGAGQNQATKTVSLTMTGASAGATIGSVFPVVGTVIGAAIGAAVGALGSLFGPAKQGQAATTWDNIVQSGYLPKNPGRAFDERYFMEAMKGAMDKGNNVWTGCGKNGYKNPDCFFQPLAQTVVAGYLNRKVPLTATTQQVMQSVVNPWLQAGGGSTGFKWAPYAAENAANGNMQGYLVQGAVDRYLAGLPILRGDTTEYLGQGYTQHQPPINVALAQLLQTTSAPSTSPSVTVAQSPTAKVAAPIAAAGQKIAAQVSTAPSLGVPAAQISSVATPNGTTPATVAATTAQQDATAALLQQILANQQANMVTPQAQQLLTDVAANGVQQTPYGPSSGLDLNSLLLPGAIVGAGILLYMTMGKKKDAA